MKRPWTVTGFVLVSAVCGTVALAAPWAEVDDYDPTVLQKALNSGLAIDVEGVPSDQKHIYRKAASQAYNTWFKDTANIIASQNRQQEFGNLYNRLVQGVNTNRINMGDPDVRVRVSSAAQIAQKCGQNAAACVDASSYPPTIYISPVTENNKQKWESDLLHEVGHTLGLDEQYDHADAHDPNKSRSRASQSRSYGGVMDNKDANHLTADDATGFINTIDHYAGNKYGRQGKEWSSLDGNSQDKYKDGKRVGADQENQISREQGGKRWSFQQPGSAKREYQVSAKGPFKSANDLANAKVNVTKKDAQGRPTEGKDQYGNRVVYSYFQGQTNRLFFSGNTLVGADQTTKRENQTDYFAHVGVNGKVAAIAWAQDNSPDATHREVHYKRDINDPNGGGTQFDCQLKDNFDECVDRVTKSAEGTQTTDQTRNAKQNTSKGNNNQQTGSTQPGQKNPQRNTNGQRTGTQQTARGNTQKPQRSTNAAPARQASANRNSGVVRPASTRPVSGNYSQTNGGNQIVGVAH